MEVRWRPSLLIYDQTLWKLISFPSGRSCWAQLQLANISIRRCSPVGRWTRQTLLMLYVSMLVLLLMTPAEHFNRHFSTLGSWWQVFTCVQMFLLPQTFDRTITAKQTNKKEKTNKQTTLSTLFWVQTRPCMNYGSIWPVFVLGACCWSCKFSSACLFMQPHGQRDS